MKKSEITKLRNKLIKLNDAYRAGEPQVSDNEYDALVEQLREASPNDEFFASGVVEEADERMEELPLPMYSLEKVKTIKGLRKWLQSVADGHGAKSIVMTPKYDGISLLVKEDPDIDNAQAWTRGDGQQGQRSDQHFLYVGNNYDNNTLATTMFTWGEAIMAKSKFVRLKEDDENFNYKKARNMVAGVFNSPTGYDSPYIGAIDYVRYGCDLQLNKIDQLNELNRTFGTNAPCVHHDLDKLLATTDEELDAIIEEVYNTLNDKYAIDGIVLEVNEYLVREDMGRLPNGNPAYAIAFKREEWTEVYQTRVEKIEYGIGKTGVLNPVIIVEPVEMDGATVTRASIYNASQLIDRHVCPGAIVDIIRSGDVIPKHLKTITYDEGSFENEMDNMMVCPSCGKPLRWDENHVNLVCINKECKERRISEMVYFFRTLGCEEFEDPTIRKMYEAGWTDITMILEASLPQMQELLGEAKGKTVFDQISHALYDGLPLARVMTACNVFQGVIAETICQKIIDGLPENYQEWLGMGLPLDNGTAKQMLKDSILEIKGVGEAFANAFVQGVHRYLRSPLVGVINVSYIVTPKVEVQEGQEQLYVCMTGFRDKEAEAKLKADGHVVLSGVTKDCNLLVVADVNSNSSKAKTARERGIRIITREQFNREILLQE